MGRSLNSAMLIGRLGADPDVRTTTGGNRVASLSLATSRFVPGAGGAERERTEWHKVIAWDALARLAERGCRRGDRIFVEGRIEQRSWQDAAGRTRYATEIIARELIPLDEPAAADPPGSGMAAERASAPAGPDRTARRADQDLPF
jgi:single-strand DNA-binding protein